MTNRLAKNRSPRWAFMGRFEVPDYDNPERTYLRRLRIIQTPWFGVMLHHLDGPDPRSTLHDHPWWFASLVLRGGYTERRMEPGLMWSHRTVRRFNVVGRGTAHTIRSVKPNTVTLVVTGPRRAPWGYVEERGVWANGNEGTLIERHQQWTRFDQHPHNEEFLAAMREREESNQ